MCAGRDQDSKGLGLGLGLGLGCWSWSRPCWSRPRLGLGLGLGLPGLGLGLGLGLSGLGLGLGLGLPGLGLVLVSDSLVLITSLVLIKVTLSCQRHCRHTTPQSTALRIHPVIHVAYMYLMEQIRQATAKLRVPVMTRAAAFSTR